MRNFVGLLGWENRAERVLLTREWRLGVRMVAQLPQKLPIFAGVTGDEWSQGLYRGTPSEAYERGLGHAKSVPKRVAMGKQASRLVN